MNSENIIGKRINSALALRNIKQKDLAAHLNVTDNTISYFCSGKRTPNTLQIIQIADFLNVSADFLLGLSPNHTSDWDLKSVCEYTSLSQKAMEMLLEYRRKSDATEMLSKVMEFDEFWWIWNVLSCAVYDKEYLYPSQKGIIDSVCDEMDFPEIPKRYIAAYRQLSITGLAGSYKQQMTEYLWILFSKVVKEDHDENP